ncbi:MAG TPA: hypothetical protein VEV83_15195 [Parafilimonas sp.]|nr:hypothetical protein [Parafilimonas sp.]
MLSSSENILKSLTGKSSFHEVTAAELQELAEQYPYFGVAQYLLAKKLFFENNDEYKHVIQRAALHFSNPAWLNFNFTDEHQTEDVITTQASSFLETHLKEDNEEPAEEYADVDAGTSEKLSSILKEHVAAFEKPVEHESALNIESTPYHRVDYFDSQGIKLDSEKETDKLGVQLKRFTDWLKQMKRVSSNPSDLGTDQKAESEVQNLAEHSNDREEVVTEAMAEVLAKQGKPEQAIRIYEKLSFLNPSKSAYFAAKIGDLKA